MKSPRICFDRLLPKDELLPQLMRSGRGFRAISPIGKAWPNGSLLRIRFMGGTTRERQVTMEEAVEWPRHANLRFEVSEAPDAEIRITFDKSDGAWSYLGTDCRGIPNQQPTMNLGFLDAGTAAHEFGHAIAMSHEHQNPHGGIEWNEQAVIKALSGPPNYWDAETIRYNVLNKYRVDQINGTKFDPDSIMLYWFPKSWTTNGIETHRNSKLSEIDKAFVASAKMYPQEGITPDEAVVLQIDARKAYSARIGKPGEEDLFTFTVVKEGRYVVLTSGNTDCFLKLYGPDSLTNLIAEDNDSGYRTNARIVRLLRPGKYLVQVRHFRPTATGNYMIKVSSAK